MATTYARNLDDYCTADVENRMRRRAANVVLAEAECEDPMVHHPSHYKSKTGLEVIDVIKAFTADLEGIEATDTGNIIKYICRWKNKNGLQDLKKCKWYLEHLIAEVENNEKEND